AFERVVGNVAGYARLLREELVDVAQHSAAAREHDAAVDDVGGELGRGRFERRPNGVHDGPEAGLQRRCGLDAAERDGLREARELVAAANLRGQALVDE